RSPSVSLFFLHDTAPTVIYTLSLHDALPIFETIMSQASGIFPPRARFFGPGRSTAMPKRPLGIETLERRCPMDASATIVDFDAQPVIGNAPPIARSPVTASTFTVTETRRSQGPDQRALPP